MPKLVLTKGLPGAGKSHFAHEYISKHKAINICKDDLRKMSPKLNEHEICDLRDVITDREMHVGSEIIWSDTNLNPIHEKRAIEMCNSFNNSDYNKAKKAKGIGGEYTVEIKDFTDVPIETCIKQDLMRLDSVGKDVIMEMYYKWLCPKEYGVSFGGNLEDAYIVDIDGTVATTNGRSHYDYSPGAVLTDAGRYCVINVIKKLSKDSQIIFVSGRKSICQDDTLIWLQNYFGDMPGMLYMRAEGDDRNDVIVKKEIYDEHIKDKYNVLGVFDDRPRVIRMWEKEGLTVFNVGKGYEF